MLAIHLKTKGTRNRGLRLQGPKLLKSLDSEIGRFRRIVCFQWLKRFFRSLWFSGRREGGSADSPGKVMTFSLGRFREIVKDLSRIAQKPAFHFHRHRAQPQNFAGASTILPGPFPKAAASVEPAGWKPRLAQVLRDPAVGHRPQRRAPNAASRFDLSFRTRLANIGKQMVPPAGHRRPLRPHS
jgi:hypothetical protein